jgi:hypothetical protein
VWVLEPVLLLIFRVLTNSKNKVISSNLSFVIPFNQIHDRTKIIRIKEKGMKGLLIAVFVKSFFFVPSSFL